MDTWRIVSETRTLKGPQLVLVCQECGNKKKVFRRDRDITKPCRCQRVINLTYGGLTKTIKDWAADPDVPYSLPALYARHKRFLSGEIRTHGEVLGLSKPECPMDYAVDGLVNRAMGAMAEILRKELRRDVRVMPDLLTRDEKEFLKQESKAIVAMHDVWAAEYGGPKASLQDYPYHTPVPLSIIARASAMGPSRAAEYIHAWMEFDRKFWGL